MLQVQPVYASKLFEYEIIDGSGAMIDDSGMITGVATGSIKVRVSSKVDADVFTVVTLPIAHASWKTVDEADHFKVSNSSVVKHNGKLWTLRMWPSITLYNSVDGVHFDMVATDLPFPTRYGHQLVSLLEKYG